ncbi:MAG: hypothetical protein ACRDMA_16165 [Solirubrobacterales bacterium]
MGESLGAQPDDQQGSLGMCDIAHTTVLLTLDLRDRPALRIEELGRDRFPAAELLDREQPGRCGELLLMLLEHLLSAIWVSIRIVSSGITYSTSSPASWARIASFSYEIRTFEWNFTRHVLDELMSRLEQREPRLRLAA